MPDFGIYIATYAGDWSLAKACVASIRHFCPSVSVCLLVDGNFSVDEVVIGGGVTVLRKADIVDSFLRTRSFGGFGYSHLIPFWEGPFERFLYADADAIFLGNLSKLRPHQGTMLTPCEFGLVSDSGLISNNWFNLAFIEREFPDFEALGRQYFFAGTFFGEKGMFDLRQYQQLLDLQAQSGPESFKCGDQGILNFLFHSGSDAKKFHLESRDYQLLAGDLEKLKPGFIEKWMPTQDYPYLLHYPYTKPVVPSVVPIARLAGMRVASNKLARPMNHFRRVAAESAGKGNRSAALCLEDLAHVARWVRRGIRNRLQRIRFTSMDKTYKAR